MDVDLFVSIPNPDDIHAAPIFEGSLYDAPNMLDPGTYTGVWHDEIANVGDIVPVRIILHGTHGATMHVPICTTVDGMTGCTC